MYLSKSESALIQVLKMIDSNRLDQVETLDADQYERLADDVRKVWDLQEGYRKVFTPSALVIRPDSIFIEGYEFKRKD